METFELYNLINTHQWTDFLAGLVKGEHTFSFPNVRAIQSCKSVAYTLNTNGDTDRIYAFKVPDKKRRIVTITVK